MELRNVKFSDFVKLADVTFRKGHDSVETVMRNSGLFNVMSVPQNSGNSREFSEVSLEEYASRKGEGEQSKRARVQQGYTKTAYAYRIAKDIGITYEMRTQNKYPEIVRELTSLGRLASNRMDLDMAHRISFGEDTTYTDRDGVTVDLTVGDGKALFDTAHLLKASAKTYRNQLDANPALSEGSLEAMETLCAQQTFNHFGEKMSSEYDTLWTTDDPTTVNVARRLLQSTASIGDNKNSGVTNVYRSKYTHKILPRVATDANGAPDATKAKYWGLASTTNTSAYLGVLEEPRLKSPSPSNNGEEFETDDWKFGVRAGYYVVVVGANWIKFSNGSGA